MAVTGERIVGVYRDRAAAEAVARDAAARGATVRIEDPRDEHGEVMAEMQQQGQHVVPCVGTPTSGMLRGGIPLAIVGGIVGALLFLPIGIPAWADLAMGIRMLLMALVGAAIGSTVGFMIGGIVGGRAESKPLATERGVTVSLENAPPEAVDAMLERDPIRVDVLDADGQPVDVIVTEQDLHGELFEERMGRNLRGTDREQDTTDRTDT